MAMYGGDATTVITPDGRTLVLPSQLASLFPDLKPPASQLDIGTAPAPASPELPAPSPGPAPGAPPPIPSGGAPGWSPSDTAALAAQTPPADVTAAPVTSPRQVPAAGPPRAPTGPVTAPGPEQGTQAPAPRRDITNEQLAKEGPAGTLAAENRALDEQAGAVRQSALVEADTATKQGNLLAMRDQETQRILEERARVAAANQAELERRMRDRDQLAAQIAATRIDRSVDHPIAAMLGILIGGLGGAISHTGSNPAYDALLQGIDRKVAAQMQDLDNKRKSLADMGVGLQEQRQLGADRLAEIDVRRDAALQQAKQQVETMMATMKAPAAIANAQGVIAKIDMDRATLRGQAAERVQAQMNTAATRAQAERHFQAQMGLEYKKLEIEQQDKMAAIAAQLLKEGKAEAAAKAKAVAEGGVFDPRSREPLLTPSGQEKMKQADQLEAAARQQQNPELAARQRQRVEELRASARLNDAIVLDPKIAGPIRDKIGTAQEVTDQVGDLIAKLEQDPSAFNREQWAGIATQMGNLANVYQKTIGERISVRAFEQTLKHILEFDPDSYFDREVSQKRAIESLKQLKGIVANDVNIALGKEGIKTDWRPVPKGEGAARFEAPKETAVEIGEAQKPNILQRVGGRILNPAAGYEGFRFEEKARQAADEEPGRVNGLPPTTVAALRGMAARADRAGDAERAKLVEALAAPIAAGLQGSGRESLATGMLETLRGENPRLYSEIVNALPAEQADVARRLGGIRAALPGRDLPPPPTQPSGFDPDAAAKAAEESSRRGREAQKAIEEKFGALGRQ